METQPPVALMEMAEVDVASGRDYSVVEVNAVHWRVEAGDFWVVSGAGSSGKSDLVATAAGLQPALRGQVRLFGRNCAELKEAELLQTRLRIGVVFQRGGRMFPHRTVAENVALPLCYHHNWSMEEAIEPVSRLLEFTGLAPFAAQTATTLGSIWQRRVGLARALALEPELLFLDEPLTGLEARERDWWLERLTCLEAGVPVTGQKPVTLVVTSNELETWSNHARQFATLRHRRLVSLGHRAEWKENLAQSSKPEVKSNS